MEVEGRNGGTASIMGIDTQSAVSMISESALKNYKQLARKAGTSKMDKTLRRLADSYEQGVTLKGIGGKQRMQGRVAYLNIRHETGGYKTIPFLVVGGDLLPKGTDGILGNHTIPVLFSEQDFGRMVFRGTHYRWEDKRPTPDPEVSIAAEASATASDADP